MTLDLWPAPRVPAPVDVVVSLPGSKSLTNRALLLASIADGPSRVVRALRSRDTLGPLASAGLWIFGHLIPWLPAGPTSIDFEPTDNPKALEKLRKDPMMLRTRFLTSDIQSALTRPLQTIQRLQKQGGFANARIAADEDHATFDHATAQHPVKLFLTTGCARHILRLDFRQRHDR